jgi:hypothetical protein
MEAAQGQAASLKATMTQHKFMVGQTVLPLGRSQRREPGIDDRCPSAHRPGRAAIPDQITGRGA